MTAQHRLATELGVPPRRINESVHGQRRITVDEPASMLLLARPGMSSTAGVQHR